MGWTADELDFIINYDIKYRLGADAGDEGTNSAGFAGSGVANA